MLKTTNLLSFRKNYYSAYGEDGIIAKVFDLLKIKKGWCVEFGAWDGIHLSNTYNLVKNKGWKAVLIEADTKRYKELAKNIKEFGSIAINSYIKASGRNSLDSILAKTSIPKNFDLLSIDIDGNDYYVWRGLKKFHPKLVVIEFNPTIPLEVEFVQAHNPKVNQGSSLSAINKLAKSKNYRLIAVTGANALFINKKYLSTIGILNTEPESLWTERKNSLSYIFQLYDGTIVIRGNRFLKWHGINIEDHNVQLVPKVFRHFPPSKVDTLGTLIYLRNWVQIKMGLMRILKLRTKKMISNIKQKIPESIKVCFRELLRTTMKK